MIDIFPRKLPSGCRWQALILLLVWSLGCVGGMPHVPGDADQVLEAADSYHARRKYFEAQELYKAFLQRYGGHERSDYAQFMLGESYFADGEFALAVVEYRILVTNYGYSEYVDDGFYKEALALHKQAPKPSLDQERNHEALEKLDRFIQVFSASPLVPEAQALVKEIHSTLAEKELTNAMFYVRHERYRSALVYLDKVIDNYPDNPYWLRALLEKARVVDRWGRRDEAIRLLLQVVEYPDGPDTARTRSEAEDELARLRR